ncbi:hypothetical protein AVEN_220517-1 [Araneus ventricosus]|uniref:Uncharacterized protein n=1 Tax=Araneus ventricosus TaxID=182803 RepID=A0A4Y2Q545_ARAVE|nr:hypothetical protein AVEN_237742-1 [Araneus ventricosus]GBN59278.1 hypothetical protein AVEN_243243-1 [Araneus ventricosus]GBN59298.1 hypothetical protein AVEN_62037-1 [Araneus ventricosus]GBN59330.1 hypothetical protein AVEN_220517-1 [Araneus ventricosus]
MLFISPEIPHDDAVADSHLRRVTLVDHHSSDFWPSLLTPVLTFLHLLPPLVVLDLFASTTEPALFNFLISFATMSWAICVLCAALKVCATRDDDYLTNRYLLRNIKNHKYQW